MDRDKMPALKQFEVGDPLGCWTDSQSWSKTSLWDLAEYINGRAFKPTDFGKSGLRVIKITELKYGISEDTTRYDGAYEEKHLLRDDDVLFAWSGNPETSLDAFMWRGGEALLNQHIFRVVPRQGIDKTYLFYLLKFLRPTFIRTARDKATSMGHVKVSDLKRLIAFVPSLPEQEYVANTLSPLDSKIELNRRMNETLQATARAMFKSWFVDFDPVLAKAAGRQPLGMDAGTAALFPNSFEDSPAADIPKGWKVTNLGLVAENPRRITSPSDVSPSTPYIGLEHMPRKNIALATCGRSEEVTSGKCTFLEGEILFGKLRPYFHKVGVAPVDGVCSTDILVLKAKSPEWYGLVLGHLSSKELVDYADAVSTGTKMPRTNWQDMARYEICLPDRRVAERFSSFAENCVKKISQNIHQSRTLASIRDALLPKLVSGEIRVKDAEKMVGEKV
jgi:type I restriction enzyme S subunit